jgi:hypothetical protein
VCGGVAKVDLIILPVQPYPIIRRPRDEMPSLPKQVSQEIGIRTVVKIQVEGHGQPLPA